MVYRVLQVPVSEMVVLRGLSGSSNIVVVVENIKNSEGVYGIITRASDDLKTMTDEEGIRERYQERYVVALETHG